MSETNPKPAPPTMVAPPHRETRPWRPADEGRCSLHRATLEPTSTGPWWPSIPSRSGEHCPICTEVDRMIAANEVPF